MPNEYFARIKPKSSNTAGVVPTPNDLEYAEIAINTEDGILFTKNDAGQIVYISGGAAAVESVNGLTGIVEIGIDNLDDVDLVTTAVQNNNVLIYDSASQKWVPSSAVFSVNGKTETVELDVFDLTDVAQNSQGGAVQATNKANAADSSSDRNCPNPGDWAAYKSTLPDIYIYLYNDATAQLLVVGTTVTITLISTGQTATGVVNTNTTIVENPDPWAMGITYTSDFQFLLDLDAGVHSILIEASVLPGEVDLPVEDGQILAYNASEAKFKPVDPVAESLVDSVNGQVGDVELSAFDLTDIARTYPSESGYSYEVITGGYVSSQPGKVKIYNSSVSTYCQFNWTDGTAQDLQSIYSALPASGSIWLKQVGQTNWVEFAYTNFTNSSNVAQFGQYPANGAIDGFMVGGLSIELLLFSPTNPPPDPLVAGDILVWDGFDNFRPQQPATPPTAPVDSVNGQVGNVNLGIFDIDQVENNPGSQTPYFEWQNLTFVTEFPPDSAYDEAGEAAVRGYILYLNGFDSNGIDAYDLSSGFPDPGFNYQRTWLSLDGGLTYDEHEFVDIQRNNYQGFNNIKVMIYGIQDITAATSLRLSFVKPIVIPPGVKGGDVLQYDAAEAAFVAGPIDESVFDLNDVENEQVTKIFDYNQATYLAGYDQPDYTMFNQPGRMAVSSAEFNQQFFCNPCGVSPGPIGGCMNEIHSGGSPFDYVDIWLQFDNGEIIQTKSYFDILTCQIGDFPDANGQGNPTAFQFFFFYSFDPEFPQLTPGTSQFVNISFSPPGQTVIYNEQVLSYTTVSGKNKFIPRTIEFPVQTVNGQGLYYPVPGLPPAGSSTVVLGIENLVDVDPTQPLNNQLLQFDAATQLWTPADPVIQSVNTQTGVVSLGVDDLNDYSGTPAAGQVLTWDGAAWSPADAPGGGSSGSVDSVNGQVGVVVIDVENLGDYQTGAVATAGQALTFDGTVWSPSTIDLNDLGDVTYDGHTLSITGLDGIHFSSTDNPAGATSSLTLTSLGLGILQHLSTGGSSFFASADAAKGATILTSGSNGQLWVESNPAQPTGTNNTPMIALGSGRQGSDDAAEHGYYVGARLPSGLTASTTYTLPSADGTSGQVLITDGSGLLSWTDQSGGGGGDVISVNSQTGVVTIGVSDLDDVDLVTTAVQNNNVLIYKTAEQEWVPSAAVLSVNTQTGDVELGIQNMDDFALNMPATGGLRYVFNSSDSTPPAGGVYNSGGSNNCRFNIYKNADADTNNPSSLWDNIEVGDEITILYDPSGVNYTATGLVSELFPDASYGRIVFTLSNTAGSPIQNNSGLNIYFQSPKLGTTPLPLAAGDILVWDGQGDFRPQQPTTAPVDSVNGLTGIVELDVFDLTDVGRAVAGPTDLIPRNIVVYQGSNYTNDGNCFLYEPTGQKSLYLSTDSADGTDQSSLLPAVNSSGTIYVKIGETIIPYTYTTVGSWISGWIYLTPDTATQNSDLSAFTNNVGGTADFSSTDPTPSEVDPTAGQLLSYDTQRLAFVPTSNLDVGSIQATTLTDGTTTKTMAEVLAGGAVESVNSLTGNVSLGVLDMDDVLAYNVITFNNTYRSVPSAGSGNISSSNTTNENYLYVDKTDKAGNPVDLSALIAEVAAVNPGEEYPKIYNTNGAYGITFRYVSSITDMGTWYDLTIFGDPVEGTGGKGWPLANCYSGCDPSSNWTEFADGVDMVLGPLTPLNGTFLQWNAADQVFKMVEIPAGQVESVNGETGQVELGITDLDDFALAPQKSDEDWSYVVTYGSTPSAGQIQRSNGNVSWAMSTFNTSGVDLSAILYAQTGAVDCIVYVNGVQKVITNMNNWGNQDNNRVTFDFADIAWVDTLQSGDQITISAAMFGTGTTPLTVGDSLIWNGTNWRNFELQEVAITGNFEDLVNAPPNIVESVNGQAVEDVSLALFDLSNVGGGTALQNQTLTFTFIGPPSDPDTVLFGSYGSPYVANAGYFMLFHHTVTALQNLPIGHQLTFEWSDGSTQTNTIQAVQAIAEDPYHRFILFNDQFSNSSSTAPVNVTFEGLTSTNAPLLNNDVLSYNSTAQEWQPRKIAPYRATETETTPTMVNGASYGLNFIELGTAGQFIDVTVSGAAVVTFYMTDAARSADSGRTVDTPPTAGDGVLLEIRTTEAQTILISPVVSYLVATNPLANSLACRITNEGEAQQFNVTVSALVTEFQED